MKLLTLNRGLLAALALSLMTLGMAACSSSEEESGGSCEDKYTNEADIKECEIRGW